MLPYKIIELAGYKILFTGIITEKVMDSISTTGKIIITFITLCDFTTCFPFNDSLNRFTVSGAKLWQAFSHFMRPENRNGEGICWQVNSAAIATSQSNSKPILLLLNYNGQPLDPQRNYRICITGYHLKGSKVYLSLSEKKLLKDSPFSRVSNSIAEVLREGMQNNQNVFRKAEWR